ncbi:unnamed protein product [Pleuronectes platessa]|uniref:EGF-like domain-containing protein n=1 Tax=Pleuronectes platessa TaxID=8262 RepID=A0A9N7V9K1_PLEPL|nr:unnamed protein product [Pleuronectes platessa]
MVLMGSRDSGFIGTHLFPLTSSGAHLSSRQHERDAGDVTHEPDDRCSFTQRTGRWTLEEKTKELRVNFGALIPLGLFVAESLGTNMDSNLLLRLMLLTSLRLSAVTRSNEVNKEEATWRHSTVLVHLSFVGVEAQASYWDALQTSGYVMMDPVSLINGNVMEKETVWMDLMKWIVLVAPPGSPLCPPGQFPCLDSVGCVDASARCDGRSQCPTGSDEENCTAAGGCLDSDWTCRNSLCVPKEQGCNGLNDCVDNSDEKDCGVCVEGSVRCPDGTCLSPEERCDGQLHCSDGSDEPVTCGRICSMNNGGCNHACVEEPWGTLCVCRVGYKLLANGAVCEDVDECASPFSPCMHHCTNTIGSYYCHCRDGFRLNGNSTCVATGNATRLLTVQGTSIGLLNVKSQQFEVVVTEVIDPVAVSFDVARGWYFWADRRGSIFKSDGRRSWKIYTGEPGIKSLACDWLNGNLYWTNQKMEAIYMQAADGHSHMTLMRKNISPSDLVLLPVERYNWI